MKKIIITILLSLGILVPASSLKANNLKSILPAAAFVAISAGYSSIPFTTSYLWKKFVKLNNNSSTLQKIAYNTVDHSIPFILPTALIGALMYRISKRLGEGDDILSTIGICAVIGYGYPLSILASQLGYKMAS